MNHADEGTEVTNKLERSGCDPGVENDCQLFERHDATTSLGQADLGPVTEGIVCFTGLQYHIHNEQGKSRCEISSAPVPGRRKFIIPKLLDFSKLLEPYIWLRKGLFEFKT